MPERFSFRITFQSMCIVFVASLFCTILTRIVVTELFSIYFFIWGSNKANWSYIAARAVVILLISALPFRRHLDDRPSLVFLVLAVSFVATVLPWVCTREITMTGLDAIAAMHGLAIIVWFIGLSGHGILSDAR